MVGLNSNGPIWCRSKPKRGHPGRAEFLPAFWLWLWRRPAPPLLWALRWDTHDTTLVDYFDGVFCAWAGLAVPMLVFAIAPQLAGYLPRPGS